MDMAETQSGDTSEGVGVDDALVKEVSGHPANPANEKGAGPPIRPTRGFWHSEMAQIRRHVAILWLRTSEML